MVGSLWASVEIIIGSFFHNLRIPFAGTMLAMISVVIMVAFHRHWKERGLFWRAGIICALMKSISPSAILLGPMTGIMAEALLMEMAVRSLGGNIFGYLLGGALALVSTLAHKIVNLLLIYGFDIVKVMVNFYEYAIRQISLPNLEPKMAVMLLSSGYAILGISAALFGFFIGRKSLRAQTQDPEWITAFDSGQNDIFQLKTNQTFSVKLLFFHIFTIITSLLILSRLSLLMGAALVLAYLVFSIFYYRQSLKHLKRPFFWFQVLVLTFLAALFYNGFQQKTLFSLEGLMAGLQMNLRAVLILVGFSSISIELRNPVIKSLLMKRGFSRLYESLGLAFSALPWIIKNLASPRQILKQPAKTLAFALASADALLASFQQKILRPRVIVIAGEKHEGKTTFARDLATILKSEGHSLGGFLAPGTFERGQRKDFEIQALETGISKPLCSIAHSEGEQIGSFGFYASGQEFGKQLLAPENTAGLDFIFIDEIGPLEMKGRGWTPSIDLLMESSDTTMIWIVRKSLVEAVIQKWKLHNVAVFDIRDNSAKQILERLP